MSKTPEEMAEEAIEWVKTLPPASERCNQCACEGYRAGYKAGVKEAEERILNEFFDNYGADEHANFALRVNAYQLK